MFVRHNVHDNFLINLFCWRRSLLLLFAFAFVWSFFFLRWEIVGFGAEKTFNSTLTCFLGVSEISDSLEEVSLISSSGTRGTGALKCKILVTQISLNNWEYLLPRSLEELIIVWDPLACSRLKRSLQNFSMSVEERSGEFCRKKTK